MTIEDNRVELKVSFGTLRYGTVFECVLLDQTVKYIKADVEATNYNAVNLENGRGAFFRSNDMVRPLLNAKLVINI